MWSAGIVLYMLLTGKHPFCLMEDQNVEQMSTNEVIQQIANLESQVRIKLETNHTMSFEAKNLVCMLITGDPEIRLSAKDALKHAWFTKKIRRDSVSQLNNARASFKERRIRKSLGIQEQFERMPIAAIRNAELLKSGLDMSTMFNVKRSVSVSEPNHF
jgi:serine/threonine protein kinase